MKFLLVICLQGIFMFLTTLTHAQTWEVVTPYPEGVINDLDVPDTMHLKGNGYYAFMYSNDGGITWTNIPFSTFLVAVDFTDQFNGWISADSGKMYHTIDGGANWSMMQLPSGSSMQQVQFVDDMHGFVITGYNSDSLFITTDGGQNWLLSHLTVPIYISRRQFYFSTAQRGWIYGSDSLLYRSDDGGYTWSVQVLPDQIYPFETTLFFLDSLNGWISGQDSLMRTYDGGQTWQCISAIRTSSITFRDTLNGIANIPNVGYTNDGGVTWNATAQSIMNLRIPGAAGLYFVNVKTESGVINFKVNKM